MVAIRKTAHSLAPSSWSDVAFTFSDAGGINPGWLSADRTTVFAVVGSTSLRYSTDDAATWTANAEVFPNGTQVVRELSDGEILVCTGSGSSQGKAWKSSGWSSNRQTATFSLVKSSSATGNYFAVWGIHVYGPRVLLAEYGLKDGVNSARYVYMSTDDGDTWSTVLDIGNTSGRHLHGVAWDRWWNRIWVTLGDSQTDKIMYSDDEGDNWVTAVSGAASSVGQCVAILPMEAAILFLTDGTANGVLRINRTAENHDDTTPSIETAYQIDTSGTAKFLGVSAFQAEGFPALLSFQPTNGQTEASHVIGTRDGYSFWNVWTDSNTYADKGVVVVTGPTVNGFLVGNSIDGRFGSNASKIKVSVGDYDPRTTYR